MSHIKLSGNNSFRGTYVLTDEVEIVPSIGNTTEFVGVLIADAVHGPLLHKLVRQVPKLSKWERFWLWVTHFALRRIK